MKFMRRKLFKYLHPVHSRFDHRSILTLVRNILPALLLLIGGCQEKKAVQYPPFITLDSAHTGIHFANKLTPTEDFNLFSYMYYYNGAGLGAGDFNNDGKIDLFFASNQGENQLYLNQGNMQFQDATQLAQIPQDGGWSTGVSVVDINNDGLLDIYVCKVGHYKSLQSTNQLLVCQGIKDGIPWYKDEAAKYGLNFSGFSTQAVFFDYDGDGDLDMFLLNHSVNHNGNYAPRSQFLGTYDSLAGQRLYQQQVAKDSAGNNINFFKDVTRKAGIHGSRIGYGLGVAVADIDMDGWPDIYVGNDFHENDYLYINQKDGTFKEENNDRLMHTSQFSMGVDVADVNNDGFPEIISMDMLPYDNYILRRSLAEDDYDIFTQKIAYGYNYQYSRNNLQFNRRNNSFTETGQYSGVYATDWSWAALLMDFDNDGRRDLFVSNGIPKRMNDIDYINFISSDVVQQKLLDKGMDDKDMALLDKFPEIKIPNRFYLNRGAMLFADVTDSIENNPSTFSNGAIYADLDNDGDLDIVVNNIDQAATVYQNKANGYNKNRSANISLKGDSSNINAIGSRVIMFAGNEICIYENHPVHGFQSSMLIPVSIGLGDSKVDSAFVVWPDNSCQRITIQPGNFSLTYRPHLPQFDYSILKNFYKNSSRPVEDITQATGMNFLHVENPFREFSREPLLPHKISTEGPALAIADINHDGLDDIFIGSSKGSRNAVYLQTTDGKFERMPQPAMVLDSMWENVAAAWVDVNNDSHPDLVIAVGGNEYYGKDRHLLPLLYLNDGKGNLTKKADAFADIFVTQSVVVPLDFDQDGFMDLFIGGRTEPWNYGAIPRSFLLKNDGSGKFVDVTEKVCPDLLHPGMVTDARFADVDKDGRNDLVLSYEWGGIDIFVAGKSGFKKHVVTDAKGWWTFLLPCDVNNDGKIDFIAGNLGLNTKLKANGNQPVNLYHGDFDGNGRNEQIMTYYINNEQIPFATKHELEKQLPYLKKKYLFAADFAKASLSSLFGTDKIDAASKLTANEFSNCVLLNKGNFQFEMIDLPWQAQLTSYRSAAIADIGANGLPDIVLMGNYYDNNVELGRLDGDFGTYLINKGNGHFEYAPLNGLVIKGQIRRIGAIKIHNRQAFVIAKNDDSTRIIQFK